jgi:hypothetical protein
MKTYELEEDDLLKFLKTPDTKMLRPTSEAMDFIRAIFNDDKHPVREHLHSTMTTLSPTRFFLETSLKTATMID